MVTSPSEDHPVARRTGPGPVHWPCRYRLHMGDIRYGYGAVWSFTGRRQADKPRGGQKGRRWLR